MEDPSVNVASNPYEAPKANPDSKLALDTEFLVSETCVLCEHELHLPAICIVSGTKTDVVRMDRNLAYYPSLLKLLYIILIFSIPVTIGQVDMLLATPGNAEARLTLSVNGLLMFGAVLGTAVLRRTIRATWYLHESYLRKPKRTRNRGAFLMAVCVALVAFLAGTDRFDFIALPIWTFALAGGGVIRAKPPRPVLRGRHHGLYIVMGLAPEFLSEVQVLIEQYGSRQHE